MSLDQAASSSLLCARASISEEFGAGRDAPTRRKTISSDGQQDREIRAARNQALFRAVNEHIRDVDGGFAELTGTIVVACECADPVCLEMLEITPDAYQRVRESAYTFVVLADHVDPGVEHVVAEHQGWLVVEMTGSAAREILGETAPQRTRDHEDA